MALMLAVVIALFSFSLCSTPSYDEALDESHNLFVKNRCERQRNNNASFRLANQSSDEECIVQPSRLRFTEYSIDETTVQHTVVRSVAWDFHVEYLLWKANMEDILFMVQTNHISK